MRPVFISYAHADEDYVSRLVGFLDRSGVEVWMDEQIPTGQRWEEVLRREVERCAALLVVVSPAAVASEWVTREVEHARRSGRPVVSMLLAGDPTADLEAVQWEDVRGQRMPRPAFVEHLRALAGSGGGDPNALAGGPRARRRQPVMIGVPPPAADCYQPRDLGGRIDAALVETGRPLRPVLLCGLGGVGKTQLAADAARRLFAAGSVDVLVWVTATDRTAVVSAYAAAAQEVLDADPSQPDAAAARFLALLASTGNRWLVVVDDVPEPATLDGLWPPATATGRVLVTSRRTDAALTSRGDLVPVGLFSEADAVAYLEAKFPHTPHRTDGAARLAERTQYLPLALAHAAAYIADQDLDGSLTCGAYADLLADQSRRLADLTPGREAVPDDYAATIAATWRLSVDAADALRPAGVARPLLVLLSLLDPAGVPLGVVTAAPVQAYLAACGADAEGARNADADGAHSADAEGARSAEAGVGDLARGALSCLRRLSLATVDAANAGAVAVHALVQRATLDSAPDESRSAALAAAAESLLAAWPDVERETRLRDALRTNAAALRRSAGELMWSDEPSLALQLRVGESLIEQGHHGAAITLLTDLVDESAGRPDSDELVTVGLRHQLACAYEESGRLDEATARHTDVVAAWTRILGPDHRVTLRARRNLAQALQKAGRLAEAVVLQEAVLAELLKQFGPDDRDALATRLALAAHHHLAGQLNQAIALYRDLVADSARVRGADHPETLRARRNLADSYHAAGHHDDAIALYTEIADDIERVFGPEHPESLNARNSVTLCLQAMGRLDEAIERFRTLVPDFVRLLGPENPSTLQARNNFALTLQAAQRLDESVALFADVVADCVEVLGPDNPATLLARANEAHGVRAAGRIDEAAERYERVIADCLRVLGPDHPTTLLARNNAAMGYESVGRLDDARALYEDILADSERVLGADHPASLVARNNLAHCYRAVGRPDEAAALHAQVVAGRERLFGPDRLETLLAVGDLAYAYMVAGRSADALEWFTRALVGCERALGPDHHQTLQARRRLAEIHFEADRFDDALEQYRSIVASQERTHGPDALATLSAVDSVGFLCLHAHRFAEAVTAYQRVVAGRERELGPDHADTVRARDDLALATRAARSIERT